MTETLPSTVLPTREPSPAVSLSVVIPVFDEEANLPPLYPALLQALAHYGTRCALIYVDDGSRDRSFAVASELARSDPRRRARRGRRNSGQAGALAAGVAEPRGELNAPIDADLQNDPPDIDRV